MFFEKIRIFASRESVETSILTVKKRNYELSESISFLPARRGRGQYPDLPVLALPAAGRRRLDGEIGREFSEEIGLNLFKF